MTKTKKTIADKQQTDGKVLKHSLAARTLKDLMDGPSNGRFKYDSEDDYKASLASIGTIDLQRECIRVGLQPHTQRPTMVERLTREYRRDRALIETANEFEKNTSKTKNDKNLTPDLKRFLEDIGGNSLR